VVFGCRALERAERRTDTHRKGRIEGTAAVEVLVEHVAVARDHDDSIVDAAVVDDVGKLAVDALLNRDNLTFHTGGVVDDHDDVHGPLDLGGLFVDRPAFAPTFAAIACSTAAAG